MIRIVLLGRTGNNLFQYALGRVLAKKHGVPLILDASWFNAEGWAQVSHFLKLPIQAKVVRRLSIGARALRKLTGNHYWEYRGVPVLKEATDNQSFNQKFLEAPTNCMLFGYFQSPLYFNTIENELRNELNDLISLSAHASSNPSFASNKNDLKTKLSEHNSVAVHVRRKDYLHHPVFNVCDSNYYRTRMDQMRTRLTNARFFIFSDDPIWCRSEFTQTDQEVIDTGIASSNPLHDLHLMSLASHHIIANSSYSWWAAWLGDKPNQQVMMPDRWYAYGINAPIEEKHWK